MWKTTSGEGVFALEVERKRAFASASGIELLIDGTYIYSYNPNIPLQIGPRCRRYTNAIKPTTTVPPLLSFLDQYYCQWINPSPCSWSSIVAFYSRLKFKAAVPQGSPQTEEVSVF